ncbi:ABC transporter substrate-binding protein [Nesterenkonia sp. MY13]|uniref:ABC transporter substrate-binding protein n=1 Tax=Nesterenkonia sedimenti TaxID=1463632 RepID=A0A7X8TJ56_9MICC|nr:ABC transporter substrate-binding protein [Nesterenkonia sedimenti]NLS09755.1 ABC transporter substrate-binding protein [Nesterenkonia sedimenti]
MRTTRTIRYTAGLAAASLVLAGCGGGDNGAAGDGEVQPLTIHANDGNTHQANFNPFASAFLAGTRGFIYEPLLISTPMQPGEPIPWLAESLEWNDEGTEVTLTLREGVQWNDGEDFDAEDVAFTFNMMIEHPSTNLSALPVESAEATDDHTAVISFSETAFADEAAIGNTVIVPEHIWADLDEPTEFVNEEDPVGTGPFELDQLSDQLYILAKNEDYWDADDIEVQEIHYPALTGETLTTTLAAGDLDWSGGFISNIEDVFINQDPENRHNWYPGGGQITVAMNHEEEIFEDVELREALSAGIDREQISEVAMQGYTPPSHPTGLPLPTYDDAMASEFEELAYEYDPDLANEILDEAGYEEGSDGIRVAPDGTPLSWELAIPSDWPDWVDISQLLEEQLAEIGIAVDPQGISHEAYIEARNNGNFELTMAAIPVGLTPYDLYSQMMSSEYAPDDDSDAVNANFGRFYSDEADEALAQFRNTEDDEEQQEALEELQRIAVEEIPYLGLVQAPNWFNYSTERWEGFPNEDDPYALGAPFQSPDNALTIRELTPAE